MTCETHDPLASISKELAADGLDPKLPRGWYSTLLAKFISKMGSTKKCWIISNFRKNDFVISNFFYKKSFQKS